MKYLLWILLLFAAAVALTVASHNPGYVLLVYPPYRVEMSLMLFAALSLVAFVSGYGLVRLVLAAVHLPAYVRKFRAERAKVRSRELLDETMAAFFEGRYAAAEKAAAEAMELGDDSVLPPIIAARCAHELREYEKRDAYLAAAERPAGDATMRLLTATKFLLDQHDAHAALHALHQLRDGGVKGHVGALTLELKAQQQAGDWDEVLRVLGQLEKRSAVDVTTAAQLRQQAWLEKLRQQTELAGLMSCLKSMPAELKRRSKIAAVAARALIDHEGCVLAQQLLADSLNAQWDSELVALYGDCRSRPGGAAETLAQIEQAEKWLKQHKDDAGLLLALGKLCLHQGLWGKAQSYLEASISVAPTQGAYYALAELAERLDKPTESAGYYQKGAELGRG